MASSFPKMQKGSANFSQSIRNRLRLKNLQAQAKNFCRVLDIRVPKIVKSDLFQLIICKDNSEVLCNEVWSYKLAQLIHINVVQILSAIRAATYPPIGFLLRFHTKQQLPNGFTNGNVR